MLQARNQYKSLEVPLPGLHLFDVEKDLPISAKRKAMQSPPRQQSQGQLLLEQQQELLSLQQQPLLQLQQQLLQLQQLQLQQLQRQANYGIPPFLPAPIPGDARAPQPDVDHNEDLPSDFPKTADWLQEMSKSQYADDLPWAACIPFLVDGEYLRLYQIEGIREEELMRICGAIIKLPTARLMIKYASQECRRIHIEKAHLRR